MIQPIKSWFSQNQALALFLIAQAVALGTAAAAILAYSVKLETRVYTMETRGAEYTVARMQELQQRITVLEQNIKQNEFSINRIIAIMTRDLGKAPP
jgi:uncharacterized protein HemX